MSNPSNDMLIRSLKLMLSKCRETNADTQAKHVRLLGRLTGLCESWRLQYPTLLVNDNDYPVACARELFAIIQEAEDAREQQAS